MALLRGEPNGSTWWDDFFERREFWGDDGLSERHREEGGTAGEDLAEGGKRQNLLR